MDKIPTLYYRDEELWKALLLRHAQKAGFRCQDPEGLIRVLLTLYASMLGDTTLRLNRGLEKHRRLFLNHGQIPRLPARAGETPVVFETAQDAVRVSRGTLLSAQRLDGDPGDGPLLYRVKEDLTVYPVSIQDIYWTDVNKDRARHVFSGGAFQPFTPWKGTGAREHRVDMWFRSAFCGMGNRRAVLFSAELSVGNNPVGLELLTRWPYRWKLFGGEEGAPSVTPKITPVRHGLRMEFEDFRCGDSACLRLESWGTSTELTLENIRVSARANEIPAEMVLCGDHRLDPNCFYPFGRPLESCAECHIFCDAALFCPGAEITLTFDLEMEVLEETLPHEPEIVDFKWIMRRPVAKPEPEINEAFPAAVLLEYWNGAAYCPLPVQMAAGNLFSHPEKQVTLAFPCPPDIAPREFGEYTGYCLRWSCGLCDALYRLPRRVHTPRVERLRFAYRMPEPQRPWKTVSVNFGTRAVQPHRGALRPFSPPPGQNRTLFLGLDYVPARSRLQFLLHTGGVSAPQTLSAVSMQGCEDPLIFQDETCGLTCTGLFSVMTPNHPVKKRLFGKERFWLCLELPRETRFPQILGIYPNAQYVQNRARHMLDLTADQIPSDGMVALLAQIVKAWVFVRYDIKNPEGPRQEQWKEYSPADGAFRHGFYQLDAFRGLLTLPGDARAPYGDHLAQFRIYYDTSDGSAANVPAEAIDHMHEEVPFITRVYNPLPVLDGSEGEPDAHMAARLEHLHHCGGRAIAECDYELLAVDFCPLVRKAKCVAGETLKLAVLLDAEKRRAFPQVRRELEALFERIGSAQMFGARIEIVLPDPVPLRCVLGLEGRAVKTDTLLFQLQEELSRFADPVRGGDGTGWPIGVLPSEGALRARTDNLLKAKGLEMQSFSCQAQAGEFSVPGDLTLDYEGMTKVVGTARARYKIV